MTIEHARALLGSEGVGMTDDEVRSACEHAGTLALIIVQMYRDSQTTERPM